MNSLLSAMTDTNNATTTTNGAGAFKSTKSNVLDLFARGSALRECSVDQQINLFSSAYMENNELALKAMFYARDVRGGQGQREAFRNQLRYLASIDPDTVRKNLALIPEYGRWDDLYALMDTKVEQDALALMRDQLMDDMGNSNPSLLAKWLKSENASSRKTKELATKTRKFFGLNSSTYRKVLSELRKRLDVVERKISSDEWLTIDYSAVPSNAMMKYRNAFARHDAEGFTDFIGKVNKGEAKINSATLYPYEIVEKVGVFNNYWSLAYERPSIDPELAQAMWDNLPDYVDGDTGGAIAVVDTSGSMTGMPINVAVSLGMYFAERNSGPFKDHFITFNTNPELMKIEGNDFVSKVRHIGEAPWSGSTNLEGVFKLILDSAVKNNVPQDEMPTKLFIISDMQFNCVQGGTDQTLFDRAREMFASAGYELPNIVFWNVNGITGNQPVTMDERGTQLVSGFSPSLFTYIMGSAYETPYELMLKVLNSERYQPLKVA